MRKFLFPLVVAGLLTSLTFAQTADEIIAKNIEARGGMDKLKSVQTVRATGKMEFGPGMEAPGTMIKKRPNMIRYEFTVQGLTAVQAYDGSSGWAIMPFMGKKDAEASSADETKEMSEDADFDGPLVDYKAKGNQVELVGKENVEGTPAYKLKVTMKNGDVKYLYIDTDSGLEIKEEEKMMIRGSEQETESAFGDYRAVDGVMFPFAIESGVKGKPDKQKIALDKVEINVPVDSASFKMPPPSQTPPTTKPEAPKVQDKKEPPKN